MTPLEAALAYAALGWPVFPTKPGSKAPATSHGLNDATTDEATIRRWWMRWPDAGVALRTFGDRFVVDVDLPDGPATLTDLEDSYSELPPTLEATTPSGGHHLWFSAPAGTTVRNSASKALGPGLDVRGEGGYVVAPPTPGYEWVGIGAPVLPAPGWLLALLAEHPVIARPAAPPSANGDRPGDTFNAETAWAQLLEADGWALHHVDADGEQHWTRPGKQRREGTSATVGYKGADLLKVFTSSVPGLEVERTYDRFGYWVATRHRGDHASAASELARLQGRHDDLSWVAAATAVAVADPVAWSPDDDEDDETPPGQQPHTDLGNARRLVAAHGHDLRYAPELGTWLAWDGTRWAEDVTGEAQRRAKAVVDAMVTEIAVLESKTAAKRLFVHWMRSQSSPRIEAMAHLARTEPDVPVLVRQLDADPWALNTLSGVIDLRTGEVTPHDRRALVTCLAPVHLDPDATCPTWEAFVAWAMSGDTALVDFVQRAVGYSLTGTVGEQVLMFCHGTGANGKSTLLGTFQALLGDYAIAGEPDLLLATDHSRHPTGIADLVGRRLVVVQELEDGRRIAEATIKQLTGGDTIRARRMRQDFFQFQPSHKLWMSANHKPTVRGTDHAIWRRLRLIPFQAVIADADRDEALPAKLAAELPGILNWALEGCRMWRHDGLKTPEAVAVATADYRTEKDHVGQFLADACGLGEGRRIFAKDLRRGYEEWCEEQGERPWSAKAMAPHLQKRGCRTARFGHSQTRMWLGIDLAPEYPDSALDPDQASASVCDVTTDTKSADASPMQTLSDATPHYPCSAHARLGDTDKASAASASVCTPDGPSYDPEELF